MGSNQVWKPELYDQKLGYVSETGRELVRLLYPQSGEKVLDLGSGTGDLAREISTCGAIVTGLDYSADMVEQARKKYPEIRFIVGDAENFRLEERFDAVFSNAALHWMKDASSVLECVWNVLVPGGRFVAEFGGHGNVGEVIKAIDGVLREDYEIDARERNPWFFPSIGQYSGLMEKQGFRVAYALHYDRPTPLLDGENGLRNWLDGFAGVFFAGMTMEERESAIVKIAERARGRLFSNGAWHADYKRIRVVAIRPE